MTSKAATRFEAVLAQRLLELAPEAGLPASAISEAQPRAWRLLEAFAARAAAAGDDRTAWLLFIALTGSFPESDEVVELRRSLAVAEDPAAAALAFAKAPASRRGVWDRPLRLIRDSVVVDVDFCAKYEHNTGIQRLVRQTLSRWHAAGFGFEMAAWASGGYAMRSVYPHEMQRVVNWGDPDRQKSDTAARQPEPLVVPVDSTVLVAEVPHEAGCRRLAALAQFSGNRVCLIGYDAIPLVSADMVPALERERFGSYLTLVKHAHDVFAISAAAAAEFSAFVSALPAQGLTGPRVAALGLPVDLPDAQPSAHVDADLPLVLCVGSHEPRKNHHAVLYAAEVLWREGNTFRLVFVGGGNAELTVAFDREAHRLARLGRQVEVRRKVSDDELNALYRAALVTVFPSLHEGYGLPVAESLAAGTPVITTCFGSTAEIAADGGCLLVDPRDEDSIAHALREVLAAPATLSRLRAEIADRPHRGWTEFATELWDVVVSRESAERAAR